MADDYIKQIATRYNISRDEALSLAGFLNSKQIPLEKAGMLISTAKRIKNDKHTTLGAALFEAESTLSMNRMISNRKNSTKDRKDTQFIEREFATHKFDVNPSSKKQFMPSVDGKLTGFRVTPIGKRDVTNIYGHPKKDDNFQPSKSFMPVYKHQKGETPSFRSLPPPKFYYFDLNGNFYQRGHETPPSLDPQFKLDKAKNIPFVKTEIAYVREASKYPNPVLDNNGIPLRYPDGEIQFEKNHGKRIMRLDFYVGNTYMLTKNVEMDYEHDVDFNIFKGTQFADFIKSSLDIFTQQYGDKDMWKYKNDLENSKPSESDEMYKKYYLERKRKLKKTRAVRKKVITKKIVKKPIKRTISKKRVIKKTRARK